MEDNNSFFKILLVGDAKVGKSSLFLQFTDHYFSESYRSTIGVEFRMKQIEIEQKSVKLQVWDTAGQERFKTITLAHYRGTHAFILIYDCSNRASFENLPIYMNNKRNHSSDNTICIVVETQIDENSRAVTLNEGQSFADSINSQFISVNNRTGFNVEQTFMKITRSLLNLENNNPINKKLMSSESQQRIDAHHNVSEAVIEVLSKILIVGDSGVGKSALVAKYADDVFDSKYISTIGINFRISTFVRNGINHKLQIWDTGGQARFRSIISSYYKGCHGVIILFNTHDNTSYENIQVWIDEVKNNASNGVKIIIVGNEFNDSSRAVIFDQASEYAMSVNAIYTEVNVKTGINVQELFQGFAEVIHQSRVSTKKESDLQGL